MRGGYIGKICDIPADMALAERDTSCPLVSTNKTLDTIAAGHLATDLDFVLLGFQTCNAAVVRSRICVSRAFLVVKRLQTNC